MAASESNTKNSLHIRSNSFPSATHPLVSQFEEHLNRLKSSESASSSSLSQKLSGLQDLYDCTDKLLQMSINQQTIEKECSKKWVDELLDRSLRILDICTAARDCLLQSKESMLELCSLIRRRRGAETGFTVEAGKYLASRKNMKAIRKAFRNFKGMTYEFPTNRENDILSILKEAEAVTVSTLDSLLTFISDPKGQLKQNRWSAISRLIQPKRVACSEESESNEFEMVDVALRSLTRYKLDSSENLQAYMGNLEICIDDLEAAAESLSRKLIKTRVSLLNIFNH
ncbi:uncharacterized protein LOC129292894 [Prosopis cineraria]|uniref:uncharacterized protein LOC129292894 n=1 Tax=Prosopis cineraria TaxID=364024 RepID=UPI00240FFD96|nr:uncharacterized protein LOC129292894 [Prosopis cineraria]